MNDLFIENTFSTQNNYKGFLIDLIIYKLDCSKLENESKRCVMERFGIE